MPITQFPSFGFDPGDFRPDSSPPAAKRAKITKCNVSKLEAPPCGVPACLPPASVAGGMVVKLVGTEGLVEKEYLVKVKGNLTENGMNALRNGKIVLDGTPLKKAFVKWQNEDQLKFVLKEGRKRQIRRMCELVGLSVLSLQRVRIGRVSLGKLPLGHWRFLRNYERF